MARQLENNFRDRICKALKATHAEKLFHQKFHGGFYQAGLPDTAVVFDLQTSWVEFKADTEREFEADQLTKLQAFTLRGIHLAGGNCGIWHWIHDRKIVQIFSFDVFLRGAWRAEGMLVKEHQLLHDKALLKSALWHH